MDEKDRNIIKTNYVELISKTDLNRLLPGLLETDIFPEPLLDSYTVSTSSPREIKRKLYLDLPKRGPTAFRKFIEVLRQTGHTELVALLNPSENGNEITPSTTSTTYIVKTEPQVQHTRLLQLAKPEYSAIQIEKIEQIVATSSPNADFKVNMSSEPLNVLVKKAEKFSTVSDNKVVPYPMCSRKRGILFLINNMEFEDPRHKFRTAADIDQKNIVELFRQCGFDVRNQHENLTLKEMQRKILAFTNENNRALDGVDCCVVVVMSHGKDEGLSCSTVLSSDDDELSTEWIIEQFNAKNCILLQSRPKIFLFQTCRGPTWDYGASPTRPKNRVESDGGIGVNRKIRTGDDMLIGYSTIPGYVSHRDRILGSWYIQSICKVFMENAHDTHVEEMLRMVDSILRDVYSEICSVQTTAYENRGFRPCYLHPGLYKDH